MFDAEPPYYCYYWAYVAEPPLTVGLFDELRKALLLLFGENAVPGPNYFEEAAEATFYGLISNTAVDWFVALPWVAEPSLAPILD